MAFVIQLIGFLGLAMSVGAFQFKKHGQIVLCKIISALCFGLHYALLGAYSGAGLEMISAIRDVIFLYQVKKNISTTPTIIGFGAFVIGIGIFTYDGMISLLPVACKLLTTVSYGMKNEKWLRRITMPSSFLWIVYNFSIGSISGMITDCLNLASILIAMYKFDFKKSPAQQSDQG
ncbi:MAG: YgjV family protein [Oscillospiraceae bacterium]|nr:YgjV family protein [Oscillospiraceae bacterium]